MKMFNAVYPAYHPMFTAQCNNCKYNFDSNILFTCPDEPNEYVCQKCLFTYRHIDTYTILCERDLKELNEYRSLY